MNHIKGLVLAASCALALATGCASKSTMGFNASDVSCTGLGEHWSMPDSHGTMRSPADFKGQVTYLFFGFAQCPDICPLTMADMAQVKHLMGSDASQLQVVFVTVDPERDTPEIMRTYIEGFDKDAVALVGDEAQLAKMADDFKAFYRKEPSKHGHGYAMSHTAGGYIFDKRGRLRLFAPSGTPVQSLFADTQRLLLEPDASLNSAQMAAQCEAVLGV